MKLDRKVKSEINKFTKLLLNPKADKQKIEEYFKQCPLNILIHFKSMFVLGRVVEYEKEENITKDTWDDIYKSISTDSLNGILNHLWSEKPRSADYIHSGLSFYLYHL